MSEHEQQTAVNGASLENPTGIEVQNGIPETKADRGEVEQPQNDLSSSGIPAVEADHTDTAVNGDWEAQEAHTNGTEQQSFSLPVREKRSEHTEKVVSATAEDPASLEAAGIKDQENQTNALPDNTSASAGATDVPTGTAQSSLEPAPSTTQPQVNGTPAKSPRVPTYLQGTAASSLRSSPKASPSPLPAAKTPQSTSKLTSKLRKVSESKAPSANATAGSGPTSTTNSPSRTARLSHLTAPTASSAARKEPSPGAASKPLERATSFRRKPVEGSHFLAPTAASASHKTAPASGSSLGRTASKRERTSINPGTTSASTARKVSGSGPPPATGNTRSTGAARGPSSGSASSGKAASGSFLDRMTRPTAASAGKTHEKTETVKSPQAHGKAGGSLGRMGSVRTKVNGVADSAGKRLAGMKGKSGSSNEKTRVPSGTKPKEVNGIHASDAKTESATNGELDSASTTAQTEVDQLDHVSAPVEPVTSVMDSER